MKKSFLTLILLGLWLSFSTAHAQEPPGLTLNLNRDFGYSSGTGKIQGTFTMKASGPEDLVRVIFLIDGQPIGEASASPFKIRFDTGSYPLGRHTLSAQGFTASGQELLSNEQVREFVPASEAFKTVRDILIPLLAVLALVAAVSYGLPALLGGKKTRPLPAGAPRSYAPLGGAICPRCSRPFAVHIYGLNLVVGKYDRCPYCGKWSLVRRASPAELKAAEAAESKLATAPQTTSASDDDLRRELEDSRFEDY